MNSYSSNRTSEVLWVAHLTRASCQDYSVGNLPRDLNCNWRGQLQIPRSHWHWSWAILRMCITFATWCVLIIIDGSTQGKERQLKWMNDDDDIHNEWTLLKALPDIVTCRSKLEKAGRKFLPRTCFINYCWGRNPVQSNASYIINLIILMIIILLLILRPRGTLFTNGQQIVGNNWTCYRMPPTHLKCSSRSLRLWTLAEAGNQKFWFRLQMPTLTVNTADSQSLSS